MGMLHRGGNQPRAERIARELVKRLTVKDLDWVVLEGGRPKDHERLLSAVEDGFKATERRRRALYFHLHEKLTGSLQKYFEEYDELHVRELCAHSSANFQLGYATALRLLGVDGKTRKQRRG